MNPRPMETGSKTSAILKENSEFFDLTFSEEPASNYVLLLEIGTNCVKACWFHKTKNLITGFANYPIKPGNINLALKDLLASHPFLGSDFSDIVIADISANVQVIPNYILESISADKAFGVTNSFNSETETILKHPLISEKATLLFCVSKKLIETINDCFPKGTIIPLAAPRIEQTMIELQKTVLSDRLIAHISDDYISIIGFKGRELSVVNSYFQTGSEDIAYYILFIAETLELNTQQIPLILSGNIAIGDDHWKLLSAYWKTIQIAEPIEGIEISQRTADRPLAEFDYLTQHLLCV